MEGKILVFAKRKEDMSIIDYCSQSILYFNLVFEPEENEEYDNEYKKLHDEYKNLVSSSTL